MEGVHYHLEDDVLVFVGPDRRLAVARITGFDFSEIKIKGGSRVFQPRKVVLRYYRRQDELHEDAELDEQDDELDERELILTNVEHSCSFEYLKGHCVVTHSAAFSSDDQLQRYRRIGGHFVFIQQVHLPSSLPFNVDGLLAPECDLEDYDPSDHEENRCRRCQDERAKRTAYERDLAPDRRLRGIDLFAGAGGLTEGFKQAGIEVVAAIEMDKDACRIYE